MFKNIKELKEFITWCKSQGIKTAKVGEITFEISEITYVNEVGQIKEELGSSKTLVDTDESSKKEEDELLFWSSQN